VAARTSANVSTARRGGLLKSFSAADEEVPKVLRDVVFRLAPGEASDPIRIGPWYHVVRLESIDPPRALDFARVRDELSRRIGERKAAPEMERMYERLRREAKVDVLDPVLREAYDRRRRSETRTDGEGSSRRY
jgi:parvulin-like peptidyl-prolyl isomerase